MDFNFGNDYDKWNQFLTNWQKSRSNKIIGNKVIKFDSINSTNTYLKNNSSSVKNGTIVIARRQETGKGQRNRKWNSDFGGLYLSIKIVLDRNEDLYPFWIVASISISICEFLSYIGLNARIKWPNDILIDNKKVAGILTENIFTENKIISIIGIGININNSLQSIYVDFPKLENEITSIQIETTNFRASDLSKLLTKLCDELELKIQSKDPFLAKEGSLLKEKWLELSRLKNKSIEFNYIETGKKLTGKIKNITKDGSLLIELASGEVNELTSGEIKLL